MIFRPLQADEIEVRVAQATRYGATLLLYKDARCDMRILDETVGPENWQKRFYQCGDSLFCSVGILCDVKLSGVCDWIWKDDAGEPSQMSARKGEASDAFKRACFNWGIGRELYTAPKIFVKSTACNIENGKNGKPACHDHFSVERIRVENGQITGISIINGKTKKRCFVWKKEG